MLRRKQKPTVSSVEESWTVSQGTHEGQPLLARFNEGYRHVGDRGDYPIQIGVAIPLQAPDEQGWPTGGENEQLQAIEGEATRLARGRAVLVGVLTVNGVRELVLYTSFATWIEQFHDDLQQAVTTHEVQVMAKTDPRWAIYTQFL